MLVLHRSDFMKILAETPQILNELRVSVRERFHAAHQIEEDVMEEKLRAKGRFNA